MKKPVLGVALFLSAVCVAGAQENASPAFMDRGAENAAAPISSNSISQVSLFDPAPASTPQFSLATPAGDSTSSEPAPAAAPASAAAPQPAPAPAPVPRFVFGDRDDYRWQLGLGVEFFRFQSNIINASMVGTNTTISYFTNSWFALEGDFKTGFAPEIYQNEHVKYFGGAGGFRIGGRRARFEPWGHALVGGAHLQPQTANNSRNSLEAEAGLGLDYRVHSRLSLRAELDWVYTSFFNDHQNNFQATAGVVFHF
jgi:hypothetical protein